MKINIYRICELLRTNILKTLIFNFRMFPFSIAIRFPVLLYGKVNISQTKTGNVVFKTNQKPHFGGWKIGLDYDFFRGNHEHSDITRFIVDGKLILGEYGRIANGVLLHVRSGAILELGNDTLINYRTKIGCFEKIIIEDFVRISWESQIIDTDFHFLLQSKNVVGNCTAPIRIGLGSWIGNRVSVCKGVVMENYTTVASNSLVNKKFIGEEGIVLAGAPARIVKREVKRIYDLSLETRLHNYFKTSNETIVNADSL